MSTKGTLYGIGVGPGDADLITVKAVKLLGTVDVIFTASSTKKDSSLAMNIVRPHLPKNVEIRTLSFPMTRDTEVTDKAWVENAATVAKEAIAGRDTAFLTLGDPLTYSTFGYLLKKMKELYPEIPIEVVPGITSYQAAAARINTPLVEAEESLLITSGVMGGDNVRKLEGKVENVVLLKVYKNIADVVEALRDSEILSNGVAISNCGRDNESITEDLNELINQEPNYWTLVLAKKTMD